MRALVVYESMYGNTHAVAGGIADGLRATHEVTVVPVGKATTELVAAADLLVVGGPTHIHGMSSAMSRRAAASAARKESSDLTMDPDGPEPAGLRGWLDGIGGGSGLAGAFDTRLCGASALTGRASRGISRLLRHHGYRLLIAPESFLVSKQDTLLDGEVTRARLWGMTLGTAARDAYLAAHAAAS
jgi:hypothetical protein